MFPACLRPDARLVLLDRDGVLNEDRPDHVRTPGQWQPIPGSLEAVARLNRAGWRVAVVTNQSGIGRGWLTPAALAAIHDRMRRALAERGAHVDAIFHCPHAPDAGCACRKPAPGLLQDAAAHFGETPQGVPFVGDAPSDLAAARSAGACPVLVRTGKGAALTHCPQDVAVYAHLSAFVDALLKGTHIKESLPT